MPQGVVIAITPSLSREKSDLSEEESLLAGCTGIVRITTGQYAGQTGYFQQKGSCCRARSGQTVDLEIRNVEQDGRIFVELVNC